MARAQPPFATPLRGLKIAVAQAFRSSVGYNAVVGKRLLGRGRAARGVLLGLVAAVFAASTCGAPAPKQAPQNELVVWKQLGKWSGRGNAQTESFLGLTGALRMHWQTKNESPKGTGTFRLVLQSAISGRDLQNTVDEKGVGEGTAYVADDPRVFQMSVESANVDWSFTVEEAMFGSETEKPKPLR